MGAVLTGLTGGGPAVGVPMRAWSLSHPAAWHCRGLLGPIVGPLQRLRSGHRVYLRGCISAYHNVFLFAPGKAFRMVLGLPGIPCGLLLGWASCGSFSKLSGMEYASYLGSVSRSPLIRVRSLRFGGLLRGRCMAEADACYFGAGPSDMGLFLHCAT